MTDFSPQFRRIQYSQSRDFTTTRWYQESLEQDYLTGMWYPLSEMVLLDGHWVHRDNVDDIPTLGRLR